MFLREIRILAAKDLICVGDMSQIEQIKPENRKKQQTVQVIRHDANAAKKCHGRRTIQKRKSSLLSLRDDRKINQNSMSDGTLQEKKKNISF